MKKGQIDQIFPLVVAMVGIGIVLVVGMLVMDEVKDQTVGEANVSRYNNSITMSANTSTYLVPCVFTETDVTINAVYNSSAGANRCLLSSANYSVSGAYINVTGPYPANCILESSLTVDYSCPTTDAAYNSTSVTINATQSIPGWLPIIIIVILGTILIGLIQVFRGRR